MAEGWMRAVAEVFVEVRPADRPVDGRPGDRHLAAVASEPEFAARRPGAVGPDLVIVSLLGQPTKTELRALVEAAAHAAGVIASRGDRLLGRVLVLGLEAPRRTRRSAVEIEFVDVDADIGAALDRSPQVLVTDAACFHRIPVASIERSTILGLGRNDDRSAYSQLFVEDTCSRLPQATVSTTGLESITPSRSSRRQIPQALGDAFVRTVDFQR